MSRSQSSTGPTRTPPVWCQDFRSRDHLIPGGSNVDPAQFLGPDSATVTLTADAAQGAVSLTVAALANAIPSGTQLDFGGAKLVITSAAAAAGATTIAVRATPTAMVTGDDATYVPAGEVKSIPSGTAIGRTFAERDANTPFGPLDAADDQVFLIPFDLWDVNDITDCELLRPGAVVLENFLPGWDDLASGVQDLIRATYHCIIGED